MDTTIVIARREQPLAPPAKLALMTGLALLNALLYLFCLVALVFASVVILLDVALLVGTARFYMSRLMVSPLRRMFQLVGVILRSLRLEEGVEAHLPLMEAEAPRLFALVGECAQRVQCPVPDKIVLEMNGSAWVRLEGVRSGRGKSTLGLGFDLLATLTTAELEAVILHEMAHARLVQRGLKRWSAMGLARGTQLAQSVLALERDYRVGAKKGALPFFSALVLGKIALGIARMETRLFAAYSRQDEFEADQAAVAVCGADVFRDALVKTALVDLKTQDLRWQERVIQSEREASYTCWVRERLLPRDAAEVASLCREAFARNRHSPFDTHPRLIDRLNHIGAEETTLRASLWASACATPLPLLDDEEAIAEKLFALIERLQAEQERKNSEELSRWERKSGHRTFTLWQGIGAVAGLGGVAFLVLALASPETLLPGLLVGLPLGLGGAALVRFHRHPAPAMLPVPAYAVWETSVEASWKRIQQGRRQSAPKPVAFGPPASAGGPEKLGFWMERGYHCLGACDYESALSCGFHALELKSGQTEALLTTGVALYALGQVKSGNQNLQQALTRFRHDPAVNWAAAWACLLTGEWAAAEAYLMGMEKEVMAHPTLLGALAMAQMHRGKTRLAAEHLRRALALTPGEWRLRLRLAQALLAASKARAAQKELEALQSLPDALAERDTGQALVRLHLLMGHKAEADTEAAAAEARHPDPETWYRLGLSYFKLDHHEEATAYFHRATATALHPGAWIGLGFIYSEQKRTAEARACFLGAINLTAPRVPGAETPWEMLEQAIHGLRALNEPTQPLFPWEVSLDVSRLPAFEIPGLHLLILAPNRNGALNYTSELFAALLPGGPLLQAILVRCEKAEMEPPVEAIPPGIVDWRPVSAATA